MFSAAGSVYSFPWKQNRNKQSLGAGGFAVDAEFFGGLSFVSCLTVQSSCSSRACINQIANPWHGRSTWFLCCGPEWNDSTALNKLEQISFFSQQLCVYIHNDVWSTTGRESLVCILISVQRIGQVFPRTRPFPVIGHAMHTHISPWWLSSGLVDLT